MRFISTLVLAFCVSIGMASDVPVGKICMVINADDSATPENAGALVSLYLYAKGLSGCISSRAYSSPSLKQLGERSWQIMGNFAPIRQKPLTPDCGGAVKSHLLGHQPAGDYEVRYQARSLKFKVPSQNREVCIEID